MLSIVRDMTIGTAHDMKYYGCESEERQKESERDSE